MPPKSNTPRVKRSKAPVGDPWVIYHPVPEQCTEGTEGTEGTGGIEIVSIDPGIINFAIRVENRGETITTKHFTNHRLAAAKKDVTMGELCCELTRVLDSYDFSTSHLLLIEKQLDVNYKPLRLAQHTISYFMIKYPECGVIEINPQIKGRQLGAGKLTKPQLKKWAIGKALELLLEREDAIALAILNQKRIKKDDLSDCVCQIEGFCKLAPHLLNGRLRAAPANPSIDQ